MPTVLIVDDDKFTRTLLQTAFSESEALAPLAIDIVTADDGAQGLTEFLKHQPDVVITDLLMPNVDGWELCRAIRSEPVGKNIRLIAMSGITRDPSVAQKLREELDVAFFTKPHQLREVAAYVAAALGMKARGEGGHVGPTLPSPPALRRSSGQLSERPLPAILLDCLEARATGHLTLRRGRVTKVVELILGHPFSVSSTARDETLGHFLVSFGVITAEQHKRAVKRAATHKDRVSHALVALGLVSPEDMVSRLTMHTCYRLAQSLRWRDGWFRFRPEDTPSGSPRGNPIDMVALVLQGLRHTASMETIPERVAAAEHKALALNPRGQRLMPAVQQYLSRDLARAWRDGITVHELMSAGVDPAELYLTLDALLFCDAVDAGPPSTEPIYDSAAEASLAAMTSTSFGAAGGSRDTGDFSVEQLSEHANTRRASRGGEPSDRLYAMLFDDVGTTTWQASGELPIELPDEEVELFDSGVINVGKISHHLKEATAEADGKYARRLLLKEYLRVQGADHYRVLNVAPDAAPAQFSAALAERKSKFSLEWFARYDLGRDYAKLEEIHATYDRGFRVLADDESRAAYDRSLTGADDEHSEPGIAAEMAFHSGWDLLEQGHPKWAIEQFKAAVQAAPDEAHYHAVLGWAHYLDGGRTAHAADIARPHLNQGLLINPDHAASHEYKGIIDAEVGDDEAEAVFHLDKALEADATRHEALAKLEELWLRRGELRSLERQYRKLIYRVAGTSTDFELNLWLKLAELYRGDLNEPDNARIALQSAARLAPDDPRVRDAANSAAGDEASVFADSCRFLRQRWRREATSPKPGIELMRLALDAQQFDAAFMVASALMARGQADDTAREMYQRYRPRFVVRAQRAFEPKHWSLLRHPRDLPELCHLFEALAPVIEATFPLALGDLEVDDSMEIGDDDLPEPFLRVRAYVAHMLGLTLPRVFVRSDFGHQIHVGAVSPPVLLAGDEALTSSERSELSFRLGRAMTYSLPGRTFAGSLPARMLKACVLAVFRLVHPAAPVSDPEGYLAAIAPNLAALAPRELTRAKALVGQLIQRSQALNLSQWARALGRTADRVGLTLCGDLPAALRYTRDTSTAETQDDLIDFAVGNNCWELRDSIGLSITV